MWMCVSMVVYVDESVYVGVHGSMWVCVRIVFVWVCDTETDGRIGLKALS